MLKRIFCTILLLIPVIIFAAAPTWKIVPDKSSLTFSGTQNGAPVSGAFKKFTGDIAFDPQQLSSSHVKITVEMASVSDAYSQLSDTLKSAAWFDVKKFPQAVYTANNFVKTGNNTYRAKGTLTVRDKTAPVSLDFTVEEFSPTKMRVKGSTTLKRTAFGVGQGEWADTRIVKDDVKVEFVTELEK